MVLEHGYGWVSGVEVPDTFEERLATRWAVRFFESHYGDTVRSADFLDSCGRL